MITLLTLLFVSAADFDAFEGYEHNCAQVKVKGEYTLEKGKIDHSFVNDDAIWRPDALSTWGPFKTEKGHWSMSEGAEFFVCEVSSRFPPEREVRLVETQLLYDGQLAANKLTGNSGIYTFTKPHMLTTFAPGPFYYWNGSLPLVLEEFSGVEPTKAEAKIAGHKVHVVVYHKDMEEKGEKKWYELAIYFEPERNFLPIYMRRVFYEERVDEKAIVQERFIRAARKCSNGAFLPTEWCATRYEIDQFTKTLPEYSYKTSLRHTGPVFVSRFVLSDIDEITGPVGFARNAEGWISVPGGSVRQEGAAEIISMSEIRRLAEGRLDSDPARSSAPKR